MSTVCPSKIVYLDESGMDNRDEYSYGWNQRGQRFHALKSGRREGRVNMITAWCNQKLIAPFTVEGACNRTVFETWLETCLLPTLQPGQIIGNKLEGSRFCQYLTRKLLPSIGFTRENS